MTHLLENLVHTSHPISLRQVFNFLHSLSHPGIKATAKHVSQRFVWPAIQKGCRTWARACQTCQRSKVSRHIFTPFGDFSHPPARFRHIHIDVVGPLPSSAGFQYCFTAVDRFTPWPEAFPIPDITADAPCSPAGYHVSVVHRPSQPRAPVRVTALPQPGETMRDPPLQNEPSPLCRQWPRGNVAPHIESRHHVSCG